MGGMGEEDGERGFLEAWCGGVGGVYVGDLLSGYDCVRGVDFGIRRLFEGIMSRQFDR